jgi:hypothetical protein
MGVALCRNHHGAFDQHRIWIDPAGSHIQLHPDWTAAAQRSPASQAFVSSSLRRLLLPSHEHDRIDPNFLQERYDYFGDRYSWARK